MAIAHINAKESKQELIHKRTMRRICDNYDTKLHRLQVEEEKYIQLSIDEKAEIVKLTKKLREREILTYYVGGIASLIGGFLGWLL